MIHKTELRWRAGRGAGFCPICRELACLRVSQVRRIYFFHWVIAVGVGKVLAYEATCEECGLVSIHDQPPVARLSRSRAHDIAELATETAPDLERRCASRLELE